MFKKIEKQVDLENTINQFFKKILKQDSVDFLLAPKISQFGQLPMPTLISDKTEKPEVSLMPVSPINSARSAIKVLKTRNDNQIAVYLRPCEIRSLIELYKLNQCQLDNVLIISSICTGRVENKDYLNLLQQRDIKLEDTFELDFDNKNCQSCLSCDSIVPVNADITLHFDTTQAEITLYAETNSSKGEQALNYDENNTTEEKPEKLYFDEIDKRLVDKKAFKDETFRKTAEIISSMPKFQELISNCINCHNCMTVCPACYCKECVFKTDVFNHDPESYLRRTRKKSILKIPTDTSMFHLTRLSHMSHSCVGCGQCSSACPNEIPVADFFKTVANQTQSVFDYQPGQDKKQPLPYQVFGENECNCKDH